MEKKYDYTITLRMDNELREKLEYLQERTALSKASVIRFAIAGLYDVYMRD